MKSAGYVLLLAIAGCTQGRCRGDAAAPAGPASAAPASDDLPPAAPGELDELLARFQPLRRGGRSRDVAPPDDAEERAYEAWVAAAAAAARDRHAPPLNAPPGFELVIVPGHDLWLLIEQAGKHRGAGAVALRVGRAAPLLVEAPHTFYDEGTLPLATSVFGAQRARALLINTTHRRGAKAPLAASATPPLAASATPPLAASATSGPDAGDEEAPSDDVNDIAHAEHSFFLSAHRALLRAFPGAAAVQLHGFKDSSAAGVAGIASGVGPGADPLILLRALRAALPGEALRAYPSEIDKLGGEQNAELRVSLPLGAPFYHLEMSRTLRTRLVDDLGARRQFAGAFKAIAGVAPPEPAPAASR